MGAFGFANNLKRTTDRGIIRDVLVTGGRIVIGTVHHGKWGVQVKANLVGWRGVSR